MKTALLTEIIARFMKWEIHQLFRKKMEEYRIPCEEPYKETAVNFLNTVISRDQEVKSNFWGADLQDRLAQKFSVEYGSLNVYHEIPNYAELFGHGMLSIDIARLQLIFTNRGTTTSRHVATCKKIPCAHRYNSD